MAHPTDPNIIWHAGQLTREQRAKALGQSGATLWMTGLSGSGKSTIASALESALVARGLFAYRLDGDNIRHGLNANLGFSAADRTENIRRIGEVAKLFADAGVLAVTSFISPYRADRDLVRKLHEAAGLPFLEVHIDCPLEIAEQRDPKGLYKKARAGQIKGFTGIDDPYQAPLAPELTLRSDQLNVQQSVTKILIHLAGRGLLPE